MGVVEAVRAAAGGLIAEELKGDFTLARALATDAPEDAETRLALGLVETLAGNSRRAQALLDAALPDLHGRYAQLAHALSEIAAGTDAERFPDGAAGSTIDMGFDQRSESRPPVIDPGDPDPDAQLLRSVVGRLRGSADYQVPVTPLADLIPRGVPVHAGWRAYARVVAAEMQRRGPIRSSRQLDGARKRYEALGDAAGVALCHIVRGDLSAAPLTSPLVLNHKLGDALYTEDGLNEWPRERAERISPPDFTVARAEYERAEAALAGVTAPRARAALLLRHAYLHFRDGEAAVGRDLAERARDGFASAGDDAQRWTASVHAALAAIAAGADPDPAVAAELGAWGANDGGRAHTVGLGMLLREAGRAWTATAADVDRAVAAFTLAEVLFEALGAEGAVIRTLDERAHTHRSAGDWVSAGLQLSRGVRRSAPPGDDPRVPLRVCSGARRRSEILTLARDGARLGAAVQAFDVALARLPALVRDEYSDADRYVLGDAPRHFERRAQLWRPDAAAHAALFTALDAERLGQGWNVDRYGCEALLAARTPRMRAIVLDELGLRDKARAAYLRRTTADEWELPVLVRLEAWPEAVAQLDGGAQEPDSWLAFDDRGQVREAQGRLDEALADYEAAMAVIDEARARARTDTLRLAQAQHQVTARPFIHAARASLVAAEREPARSDALRRQAFKCVERGKARALLDVLAASTGLARGKAARRWREADAALALSKQLLTYALDEGDDPELVAALDGRVRADELALDAVEAELATTHPKWRDAVLERAPVRELDDITQRLAEDDALLLEYALLDRDLVAFAITGEGIVKVVHERLRVQRVTAAIAGFWEACSSTNVRWQELALPLEEALIAPFADALADRERRRLMIVASGAAHRLPFSALRANGQLLRDSHDLSMVPSASALHLLDGHTTPGASVLALGNPADMSYRPPGSPLGETWEPLPYAGAAAGYVANLFARSRRLIGHDATEDNLRAHLPEHELVLLATHAQVTENPLQAFLTLAGGDGLELHELLGLDFSRADLVVLAACETDGGSITGGDEVVGLTRALLVAGAARALVTLWNTDARSLPLYVRSLFEHLRAGLPPAAATRRAQCDIAGLDHETARQRLQEMHDGPFEEPQLRPVVWDHPRHWAPYVLHAR